MKLAPDQTPTALGRSSSAKSTVSADRTITMIPAPATPRTTRAAMNSPGDVEKAVSADPAPNNASDVISTFLRPYRSPSSPAGSMAAASTRR